MKTNPEWLAALAAALLAGACAEQGRSGECPDGGDPVDLADSSSCVVAVVETGFLCSGARPYTYEGPDGVIVCSDSPDLSGADVEAIVAEHAAENSRAVDAVADAGRPDSPGASEDAGRPDSPGESEVARDSDGPGASESHIPDAAADRRAADVD